MQKHGTGLCYRFWFWNEPTSSQVQVNHTMQIKMPDPIKPGPACLFGSGGVVLSLDHRLPRTRYATRARQSVADFLNRMGGSIENEVVNFGMTGVVWDVVQRIVARRVWLNHVAQLI